MNLSYINDNARKFHEDTQSTVVPVKQPRNHRQQAAQARQAQKALEGARNRKVMNVHARPWDHRPRGVVMTMEAYQAYKRLTDPMDLHFHQAVEIDPAVAAMEFDEILVESDIIELFESFKVLPKGV